MLHVRRYKLAKAITRRMFLVLQIPELCLLCAFFVIRRFSFL